MSKNCLFGAQIDCRESRRLIRLLALELARFVIHSAPNRSSAISATSTASRGHARVVKNRQNLLRAGPALHINFLA